MRRDLFSAEETNEDFALNQKNIQPLALRIRPNSLKAFQGQKHILSQEKLLYRLIKADKIRSAIFYGPSGCGKSTLGSIIAEKTNSSYKTINAVTCKVSDLRALFSNAKRQLNMCGKKTILFVDEIHRFNKAQQDVLMPEVENGTIIMIGATTHNPSFSVNAALLSRSTIFEFKPLDKQAISAIIQSAISYYNSEKQIIKVEEDFVNHIIAYSDGDARRALNAVELAVETTNPEDKVITLTKSVAEECLQKKALAYDKDDDNHYDTISAFIKSMRGSDPHASIYWLAKMIDAGEDPLFIARRIVIFASEDIGNADPNALDVAVNVFHAVHFVGLPEARISLAQAVTYMATAPKSNASYVAIENALYDVRNNELVPVPMHLRDTSYKSAKKMGHGVGYKYPHSYDNHYVEQEYLGVEKTYYEPVTYGYEKTIKERMAVITNTKKGGAV